MALCCLSLLSLKTNAQTNKAQSANQKTTKMKEFSLLVSVPVSYTAAQAKATGEVWNQTIEKWKADGVYVTSFAFPGEGYVVAGAAKAIRKETVVSNNLKVVSNIVLRAETIAAASALAKDCPILQYGGMVEVREIPLGVPVPIK